MDLSVGVSGDVNGEAKLSANPELVGYAGKLELSIACLLYTSNQSTMGKTMDYYHKRF